MELGEEGGGGCGGRVGNRESVQVSGFGFRFSGLRDRVGGGGRWLKGEGSGEVGGVWRRGRTLNPRDSMIVIRDKVSNRATGFSKFEITSDSGFGLWTRKLQTQGLGVRFF